VAIASVLSMNHRRAGSRTQHWLIDLMAELNEAGKTIVVATHDLAVLDQMAYRCVVFSEDHTIAPPAPRPRCSMTQISCSRSTSFTSARTGTSRGETVIEHSHQHPSALCTRTPDAESASVCRGGIDLSEMTALSTP
jgi:energy-coupling factor transporter ATP-binding protein EcfA2